MNPKGDRLAPDDLEWEELPGTRSGVTNALIGKVAEMRSALASRRGSWAVLDAFEKDNGASVAANAMKKHAARGDSRLDGIELAGRRQIEGGSKLYVRADPTVRT